MPLSEDILKKYQHAGKIAAEARERIESLVHEGMPIIDLCEKTEAFIRENGGQPAFPCNVSINEVAAHYTSPPQDEQTIPENSLVKIDIGVHVDGYIADTATTVCFNPEYENLVHTAKYALEKAVEILRPGLSISQFGSTIQKTIKSRGVNPISNLTGHKIGYYMIHAGKSLPNVYRFSMAKIKEGEIYGVEPFVTTADAIGEVTNSVDTHIFRFLRRRSLRDPYAKQLLNYIRKKFRTLPFTERWLQGLLPQDSYDATFSKLLSLKCLMSYPVLVEKSRKTVAQAEHTVLIVKDGCLVLT